VEGRSDYVTMVLSVWHHSACAVHR